MQRTLTISRFVCRKTLTQCSTLLLLMPRRGGLLYLYNAKNFSMIRWYVLYSLSPCCRRGFNGSFGSGVNVFYSLSPCCRRGFNGSFGSGVKSLNTKIVRKITAWHCIIAAHIQQFVHQPFLFVSKMEHVCSKVEIIFLRLMDYTEIRNKIVLCMTLQNRLDFPIFRRARFAQYIEPFTG